MMALKRKLGGGTVLYLRWIATTSRIFRDPWPAATLSGLLLKATNG
jgi:hypothetical protein